MNESQPYPTTIYTSNRSRHDSILSYPTHFHNGKTLPSQPAAVFPYPTGTPDADDVKTRLTPLHSIDKHYLLFRPRSRIRHHQLTRVVFCSTKSRKEWSRARMSSPSASTTPYPARSRVGIRGSRPA